MNPLDNYQIEAAYNFKTVQSFLKLYEFHEAPAHQQHNPYITSGYRCFLSARQCLQSVFFPSNELINIWTHMVMVFIWIALFIYDEVITIPSMKGANISDYILFACYTVCVITCMAMSVGYHVFNSHSTENVCLRWYTLDLVGITIGTIGCYIPGIYYGYFCFPHLQTLYISVLFFLILITGFLMTRPFYLKPEWTNKRIVHLSSLVIFGIVPAFHWVMIAPSLDIAIFLPKVITLYCILGCAFFIYTSKVPEYFLPGKFNWIGHSHNIWHVLVAISFVYWRSAGLELLMYRLKNECDARM